VDGGAGLPLGAADLERDRGAFVEELEELAINVVDPHSPFIETHTLSKERSHKPI
jgi:hypothetical protein